MTGKERRKAVRVAKPIEIEYEADCPPIQARIEDLSAVGLYVDTNHPLEMGALVKFKFHLSDDQPDQPLSGKARVVWVEPNVGAGLEFVDLREADSDRINFFVASVMFS